MLQKIEIPHYITKVVLSQKRKPQYYVYNTKTRKFNKAIPDKVKGRIKVLPFRIGKVTKMVAFIDGQPLLQNPRAAGTPQVITINGQNIYNGSMHPMQRYKIINTIKEFFIERLVGIKPVNQTPVEISFIFEGPDLKQDLDNHAWIYIKCFLDCLVSMKILPEDTIEYIRKVSYEFNEAETPKLTIEINERKSTRN